MPEEWADRLVAMAARVARAGMPRSLEIPRPRSVARVESVALRFRLPEMAGMAEPGVLRHPQERFPVRLAGRVEMAVPAARRVWVEMVVTAGLLSP